MCVCVYHQNLDIIAISIIFQQVITFNKSRKLEKIDSENSHRKYDISKLGGHESNLIIMYVCANYLNTLK